jgi:serine/threonine protein phosphatase PrpC
MLARLRGMADAMRAQPEDARDEVLPAVGQEANPPSALADSDLCPPPPAAAEIPEALPVAEPAEALPLAELVAEAVPVLEALPADAPVAEPVVTESCPHCHAPRRGAQAYCDDCGLVFPTTPAVAVASLAGPPQPADPTPRLHGRYELGELLGERPGVARHRGLDHGAGEGQPVPVTILRSQLPEATEVLPAAEPVDADDDGDVLPGFGEPAPRTAADTDIIRGAPEWPSVAWETVVLRLAADPALPRVLDDFVEDNSEYLVLERPQGLPLWDAWDDQDATARQRFGWLKQVADTLRHLHQAHAILEGLRPDVIVVTADGQARFTDLADLLPLSLPPNPPVRATLYTAPELVVASEEADARADLYHFGAMLYSLFVGRELAEMDFDRNGVPKPFIPRFPDVHPALGRLVSKTFAWEVDLRFPSDEAAREDRTGFAELIQVLEACRRTMDTCRLELAAWTTTGMVRTGNEDAYTLLHAAESRQDALGEAALLLLADGMGGYEAGEVAATLALQALRKNLLGQPPFAFLAGQSNFQGEGATTTSPTQADAETYQQLILAALKDANKQVFTAARTGVGRRGMGCTAEVVFVNGRDVIVGHVGDSRTYHLHQGRLIQVTRDQTLVNRLVELGTLTPEEAENHPRRSELQQAIGGHGDVEPGLYRGRLLPGDWVLVCSDGLSNHVTADELKEMLQSEATSAEMAARRLVNYANVKGATDNATVVVIRAT